MSRKLALKKLKQSDLSFFLPYLNKHPQAKQKGFNLDRSVIETTLFPTLAAELEAGPENRAPVALTFFGPGGAAPYLLMRKVLKQQKNWRLNGEAVPNPTDDPTRFDSLAPEDIAIMEFSGASIPNAIKVVLLSASHPRDAATHKAFSAVFPGESMSIVSEAEIEKVIGTAMTPADHPIRDWLDKDLLEGVGFGDAQATERLQKKRRGRGLTAAELGKAKASAARVGRLGEELLDFYLDATELPEVASYTWVADVNAISPYDFELTMTAGGHRHIDAKSTSGPFANAMHLSLSEIHHALTSSVPYDIYRLYNVRDTGASVRVAKDIAGRLKPVITGLEVLPKGVTVDSLSFEPDFFDFGSEELTIECPEQG